MYIRAKIRQSQVTNNSLVRKDVRTSRKFKFKLEAKAPDDMVSIISILSIMVLAVCCIFDETQSKILENNVEECNFTAYYVSQMLIQQQLTARHFLPAMLYDVATGGLWGKPF